MKKSQISELLYNKINEVFAEAQKQEGIQSGDVEPMDEVRLDELTDQMADLIAKIVESQKEL